MPISLREAFSSFIPPRSPVLQFAGDQHIRTSLCHGSHTYKIQKGFYALHKER